MQCCSTTDCNWIFFFIDYVVNFPFRSNKSQTAFNFIKWGGEESIRWGLTLPAFPCPPPFCFCPRFTLSFLTTSVRWTSGEAVASLTAECGRHLSGMLDNASKPHSERFQNLAFAGASKYERGILSFKHSSADGQSAGLTDLPNGEQVNKYTIRECFTITALLSHIM